MRSPGDVATETAAGQPLERVALVDGLDGPESARYDPTTGVFFVSNVNGEPRGRDNNGYIARVGSDGAIDSLRFIAGGHGGVRLDAPKGLALTGDTLWVADIDAVRAFDARTGAPVGTIDLTGRAWMLNDITVGPDGALYVTDTGSDPAKPRAQGSPAAPGQIFRVERSTASVALRGDSLNGPNGITWDAANRRFIVAAFRGSHLYRWHPDSGLATLAMGPGRLDGVEVLADGRMLVTSWADSSLHVVADGRFTTLVAGIPQPADIGIDTRGDRVAIPLLGPGRVEIWPIPRAR